MKDKISITIEKRILDEIDAIVDNIFIRNRSQAIEYLVNNALGDNKTAVILCGGPEEKMMISEDEFSPTAKVNGKSIVEKAISKLRKDGFKTIYIIARHNLLTRIFGIIGEGATLGVKVNYVEEKNSNGTSDSLRLLQGKIKKPFLVVYGDIVFDKVNIEKLWKEHLKSRSIATLMLTTSVKPSSKGTVNMEGNQVLEFVQKPKTSDVYLVFSPIFVAEAEIMEYKGSSLEIDVFPKLAENNLLMGHLSSQKELHIHKKSDLKKVDR